MTEKLAPIFGPFAAFTGKGIETIGVLPFLVVLAMSLACGLVTAYLYRRFYSQRETGTQIHRAFPLLSLGISAIFICIQFSLPLSLGLLGALSIVRFRTPVKEPEEIGFLMLVIATSLACATFNFRFLGIILLLAVVALLLQEAAPGILRGTPGAGVILISLPQEEFAQKRPALFEILDSAVPVGRLESLSQDSEEVVVTYSFRRLEPAAALDVQQRLGDELSPSHISLSYERDGGL